MPFENNIAIRFDLNHKFEVCFGIIWVHVSETVLVKQYKEYDQFDDLYVSRTVIEDL
jgi:hypothetical protein